VARAVRIWAVLSVIAILAMLLSLAVGSASIGLADIVKLAASARHTVEREIVWGIRMPRALAAFVTGALLAYAGALMQILLRNPLADPYVLGLSGGAAVGALGAMILGLGHSLVDLGASGGALLSVVLVFVLARGGFATSSAATEDDSAPRLLLTGVVLASGWSAIITLMLAVAPDAQLRGMLFWLMGDLGGADMPWTPLIAAPLLIAMAFAVSRDLNVLLRGEIVAQSLGVNGVALRRMVYVLASVATALAVTTAGTIGFVGLIVPHALRLVIGNDQRVLLPACALAGGSMLVLADTLARTIIAPAQLPVGAVTAMIGVPVFMMLLVRSRSLRPT
jgi:iron complex transport system permease protein